ncbi:restriction endonuclease subunit S [Methanosarcina sp.]|uniref:restriction endonuclease subunit S n=1 Tax=Methanosarcina sp. TaxID=2213 RepID=UPI003C757864
MQQKSELPEGWIETRLDEISIKITDGTHHSPPNSPEGDFKYITAKNIKNDGINLENLTFVSSEVHNEIYSRCNPEYGDLLLIKDGATTGIATLNNLTEPFSMLSSVALLKFPDTISNKYIMYYIRSPDFQTNISEKMGGVAITRLTLKKISSMVVALPSLPEQHRIVSAIEALFARLDATNKKLDRVQEVLKKFRQSVLAAACNGRITEEWRKDNPDIEPISSLIRHMQYSEKNLKSHANYKVKKIDESELPELSSKWEWYSIISVSNRVTVGHVGPMKDEYIEEGIPFLRSQNVRENRYDPSGLKYISPEFHDKIKKSALEPNDLVVVRSGNVGVSCVIPDYLKEANCSDLVVVKQPFGFVSEYGSYYLNSIAKSTIELNKVGIALSHFNTQSVANLPIPLPPLPEQHEIVRRVDALFAFADSIEAKVAAAREKTEKLRQSILEKAFSGELVETEAEIARREGRDYETAEVLLEKIKKEKKKSGKKK